MKIPRVTVITLGVTDLGRAAAFYKEVLGTPPGPSDEAIAFIQLPGAWLALYPFDKLAEDISPEVPTTRGGFGGVTLAYNARSREEVLAVIERAQSAGARVMKAPQETFWGGFSGYFADLDGYYWEVVWGPMFDFSANGELRFRAGD